MKCAHKPDAVRGRLQLLIGGQLHQTRIKLKKAGLKRGVMRRKIVIGVAQGGQPGATAGHAIQYPFETLRVGVMFEPAFTPHYGIERFKFFGLWQPAAEQFRFRRWPKIVVASAPDGSDPSDAPENGPKRHPA